MKLKYLKFIILIFINFSCDIDGTQREIMESMPNNFKILSLGDSYTIGQSVCDECNFPVQLKDSLQTNLTNDTINVEIIAVTGWTTTSLINSLEPIVENDSPDNIFKNNNLVTLLIGVNNQFQNKPFSIYEEEFPDLVNKAISLTTSKNEEDVLVVSIPDYAFTPAGLLMFNPSHISEEIDLYNSFAENYCLENNITYVNITDITRLGIGMPELVADDNLHPSTLAYKKFVERIFPIALSKLLD
ncbi:MAG: SGNH/GDSL hydrolase family protein [Flavobacteriales bacterium]|jgi:acyl-CoA thioesterase-1|tara:strand:- start:376 stop:1107 length:732 start_codon:yes stop_codon:yes gene_type:complete